VTHEQEHYGTITGPVQGGWHPDHNPREAYDYVDLLAGDNVYLEVEFGTWTAGEGSTLIHGGSDDLDVFVWPPGVAHTYANSLARGSYGNPECGTFVAPVSGNYTIGLDYYSGVVPMGWRCYIYRYRAVGVTTDGLWSKIDTAITGENGVVDVRVRAITGTSLDADDSFSSVVVPSVGLINFFPPVVTVTSPGSDLGETYGGAPFLVTWTASDENQDETLHFSVEISNDSGATWSEYVNDTTSNQATVNPLDPALADMLPSAHCLIRINVTDGRFTSYDVSDNEFTIAHIEWVETPSNQIIEVGQPFSYDLNATAIGGVSHYWIGDISRFTIDGDGVIANTIPLGVGVYAVEVRAYDAIGTYCSAIITICVQLGAIPVEMMPLLLGGGVMVAAIVVVLLVRFYRRRRRSK
jgi:hypothetical protein